MEAHPFMSQLPVAATTLNLEGIHTPRCQLHLDFCCQNWVENFGIKSS